MSFSSEVKEELAKNISPARHCQMAELAAYMYFAGQIGCDGNQQYTIGFTTENPAVLRKGFTLLEKTYNINLDIAITKEQLKELYSKFGDINHRGDPLLIKNTCCQRAFLRGAFLCIGSLSDPEKGYHLEFVCINEEKAQLLQMILKNFEIDGKIVLRKKYFVVYVKEGAGIVDLLNVMEAHISLMDLENLRILKEMRNSINRKVNCEAANITKTVNAASRQIEDIIYIKNHYGFENLQEGLCQMAQVRLEYPEATLKELGEKLEPNVGKSGVNHRLRKLSQLADRIRL